MPDPPPGVELQFDAADAFRPDLRRGGNTQYPRERRAHARCKSHLPMVVEDRLALISERAIARGGGNGSPLDCIPSSDGIGEGGHVSGLACRLLSPWVNILRGAGGDNLVTLRGLRSSL
eukprot:gene12504-biopygen19959